MRSMNCASRSPAAHALRSEERGASVVILVIPLEEASESRSALLELGDIHHLQMVA